MRSVDVANLSEARARFADPCELDCYHALEAEHAGLLLAQSALQGLKELAASQVLDESELDQALSARPVHSHRKV